MSGAALWAARCLAFAIVLFRTVAASAAQELPPDVPAGDARLVGRVVHDERADAGAGVGIILYSLSASGEPGLRQTRADAEGAFRFEGISGDPSVVYLIGTRVSGVPFGARVSFALGETQREVEIRVSDPSQAVAGVATLEPELLLSRGCTHLRVRHRHPLRNDSERVVFVPPEAREDATPLLELLLPEAASEIETPLGSNADSFDRDGRRLRYWGPLYPGDSGLEFVYGLPLESAAVLRIGFPNGTESLRVFTPLRGTRVSGAGLTPEGEIALEEGPHHALRAAPVAPGEELQLEVTLAAVADVSSLRLTEARIWLELDDARMDVSEQYQLYVDGQVPLVSESDAPLLCVELPADAEDLRFSTPSLDLGLSRDPLGALALHGPLPPGESSLSLRYLLPANPGAVRFSRRFTQRVPLLTLLVADTGLIPTTESLHPRRPVRTEDRSYLHLEGFGIEAGETISVLLTPLQKRRSMGALASSGFVLLAGLGALLFLVAPLRSQRESAELAEPDGISTGRQAVYQSIEALDDDFETGKLTHEDHQRMRAELRARAVALLREEREAQGAATSPREEPATCTRCGAALRTADRFCSQCGAPLAAGTDA